MSVFPLNIEEKEDSPDKVALLDGVASKYYQTALEINKKVAAINELKTGVSSISQGTGQTFATRVLAMAKNPLPPDDTPFVVYNETAHNGQYRYNSAETNGYTLIALFFEPIQPPEVYLSGVMVLTIGNTDPNAIEVGNTFRGWSNGYLIQGIIESLPFNINDDSTYKTAVKTKAI